MPYTVNPSSGELEFKQIAGQGGVGDVMGPASSTDNAIARYDGVTGKIIQNSNAILDDTGLLTLAVALPITSGGTGQTTKTTAFDALSPLTTKGDLIVYNGTDNIRISIGTNNQVLTADSTQASGVKWADNGTGTGDVFGPASSTDNALARFDGITGKIIQNSNATLDDAGNLSLAIPLPVGSGGTGVNTLTGIAVGNGTSALVGRSLTQPAAGITITNANGTAGNPTFALSNDLAALEGLATTGLISRTATDTMAARTITAASTKITITNGGGVAGNPTIDAVEANFSLNNISGTLALNKGGTGQITKLAAFNALSPLTTKGDLIIFDGTNNIRIPAGSDGKILVSNSAATEGVKWESPATSIPGVRNIGFSYVVGTGVFTIQGQDGIALSTTNPAYITIQSKTNPGQLVTIAVTANQNFIDDIGASEIIGNLFGLTSGIAITSDIPFYLYAVSNDAENAIAFMISRFPNAPFAPITTKIGMPSSAIADTQGSFWSLDNITVANYDLNPCLAIGAFRMRMSSLDDWTVQSFTSYDGIGRFLENFQFNFPRGQFGAAAAKVFKNNGGTAPDDADGGYGYYINQKTNRVFFQLAFPSIDTAGVGAVTALLAGPYLREEGATAGSGFLSISGGYNFLMIEGSPSSNNFQFPYLNFVASGICQNATFGLTYLLDINGNYVIEFS